MSAQDRSSLQCETHETVIEQLEPSTKRRKPAVPATAPPSAPAQSSRGASRIGRTHGGHN